VLQHSAGGDLIPDGWSTDLKIPHMGWNTIHPRRPSKLLDGLDDASYFYFVHSFVCLPDGSEDVVAECRYGADFAAVVERNNVYGVQFHPEKSQQNGLRLLRNFAEWA
jgi:glutamine amidotransferase